MLWLFHAKLVDNQAVWNLCWAQWLFAEANNGPKLDSKLNIYDLLLERNVTDTPKRMCHQACSHFQNDDGKVFAFLHWTMNLLICREISPSTRIQVYKTPSWTWPWQPLLLNLQALGLKTLSSGSTGIWLLWWPVSILAAWRPFPVTSAVHPTQLCKR